MSSLPYLGSKIALISNAEIRYEGILHQINTEESTISLQQVRSFGTEGRRTPNVPASDEIYEFIIFRGKDIKDLFVLEDSSERRPSLSDPAIVTVSKAAPVVQKQAPSVNYSDRRNEPLKPRQPYQQQLNNNRDSYQRPERRSDDRRYDDRRNDDRRNDDRRSYQPTYRGFAPRGRGGRGGRRDSHSVGELAANENATVKAEVKEDFDFSSANSKFSKPEEPTGVIRAGYSKTKSFFDDISCDALDRAKDASERIQRDKLRSTDRETFGAAALNRPFGGVRRPVSRGGRRF